MNNLAQSQIRIFAFAELAIRIEFPDDPCQIARGFSSSFLWRRPMGLSRPRVALSRLRVTNATPDSHRGHTGAESVQFLPSEDGLQGLRRGDPGGRIRVHIWIKFISTTRSSPSDSATKIVNRSNRMIPFML